MRNYTVDQSAFSHFFTVNARSAPLWFIVRLYLGWEWLIAGWEKAVNPVWFGSGAGAALQGFIQGAVAKSLCAPSVLACYPDVQTWYALFLQGAVLPHIAAWSHVIVIGEILVGLGLIVGLFTGVAAFFGFFMNLNFLLAGTVSTNPVMLLLALGLVLSRRVAGHWGLDRYARPFLRRKFQRLGTV